MPIYSSLKEGNIVEIKKTIIMLDVEGNEIEVVDEQYEQPIAEIISNIHRLDDDIARLNISRNGFYEIIDQVDMAHLV